MADEKRNQAIAPTRDEERMELEIIAEENERNSEGGEEEDEEMIEEGEDELVILDPSHPLMERVQAALGAQLERQSEKLEIELREKQEMLKNLKLERESIGVELYGVQQQLARQQMFIEKEQDTHSTVAQLRKQKEETLTQVRDTYQSMQAQVKNQEQQTKVLSLDVDSATARLRYLSEAQEAVKQDIALTKRATEKAVADITQAEADKLKQDLFLDQLTQRIQQLDEQIALYNAQCSAQAQDTKAVREAVTEASMELETLNLEKKRLMHQLNNSLIGMRRRDEAFSAMTTAKGMQEQEIRSMETEMDNCKKSIVKEQENNERLTLLMNKVTANITHVQSQIERSMARRETLKMEYMTYSRTLQETEQALAKVSTDCTVKRNELSAVRTQIEREALEKRRLEDTVMEKLMQKLTLDKATQYTRKSVQKIRQRSQLTEISLVDVENETVQAVLEASNVAAKLEIHQKTLDQQTATMQEQNELISKSETEIARSNALIERKQTQIDQLNKKIEHLISSQGGEELGPLELKIGTLQDQMCKSVDQCAQMQHFWLRQQNELVKKTQEADEQTKDIQTIQKQQLILTQKRMRIDGELEAEDRHHAQVQHSIGILQRDMVRLCTLITEKQGKQDELEQHNALMEKGFVLNLKEAELEFLQLQCHLDQLKEEKERLLNNLVDAQHQMMLWERKIQLGKEMKKSVDSEAGQAEVRSMKAEIHRMQVRYSQLMRQQEKLIQDMEKAVYRRETIIEKGAAQVKSGKQESTQGHLKKKIIDVQRKIKQAQKDSAEHQDKLKELHAAQLEMASRLRERQDSAHEKKASIHETDGELKEKQELKSKEMAECLAAQAKLKHLQAAKENRYRMLHRTHESRAAEMERQREKLHALYSVVQKIESDMPEISTAGLKSLAMALKSRIASSETHLAKELVVA